MEDNGKKEKMGTPQFIIPKLRTGVRGRNFHGRHYPTNHTVKQAEARKTLSQTEEWDGEDTVFDHPESAGRPNAARHDQGTSIQQQHRLSRGSTVSRDWTIFALRSLPPCCPDHNRIERTRQNHHASVTRNHRCSDISESMKYARYFLQKRNQQDPRYPQAA